MLVYRAYTPISYGVPSFRNLALQFDHKDGYDRPNKHQRSYRETQPSVQGFGRER